MMRYSTYQCYAPPTTSRGYVGIYGGDLVVACPAPRAEIGVEPSLAGQPLHREEGSGVMPIHELFQRLCNTYGYATKT